MKAEVETIGKYERSVKVEVPVDKVDHELAHVLHDLRQQADLPGFRKGKAPESVIWNKYRDYIDSHAKEHLINDTLPELLEKESIIPVSEPVIDAEPVAKGKTFTYTARFEVQPKVNAKNYEALALSERPVKVGDESVAERLEQLREQHAQLRGLPEDHEADLGDTVMCEYKGTAGEHEISSPEGEDAALELGAEGLLPGIAERLKGVRAGDERDVQYKLPDDTSNKDLAGQELKVHFKVKSIRRRELPALDDEFAKDLDAESLDDLKKKIREQFEEAERQKVRGELREQAIAKLIEKNEIDVPPSMIEAQSKQMIEQTRQQLAMQGLKMDLGVSQLAEIKDKVREDAVKAVKATLLLESIAEQEGIEHDEAKVEQEIRGTAQAVGQPYDKVRALYEQRGLLAQLRGRLRREAALDFVLDKAKIGQETTT